MLSDALHFMDYYIIEIDTLKRTGANLAGFYRFFFTIKQGIEIELIFLGKHCLGIVIIHLVDSTDQL